MWSCWDFESDEDRKLTTIKNGSRTVVIDEKTAEMHPLPRQAVCGNWRCRIFHKGQPKVERSCFNCFQTGHWKNECRNERVCRVCRKAGHTEGEETCEHYMPNDAIVFMGEEDMFSNFYKCNITWKGTTLPSSEHIYQLERAEAHGRPDVAVEIQRAVDAREAKRLSHKVMPTKNWEEKSQSLMMDILRAKIYQNPYIKEALLASGDTAIAECVPYQMFWSCGLSKDAATSSHPDLWPGKNILGEMWVGLRDEFKIKTSQQAKSTGKPKLNSTARNVDDKSPQGIYKTDTKRKHSGQDIMRPVSKPRFNGTTPEQDHTKEKELKKKPTPKKSNNPGQVQLPFSYFTSIPVY